MKINSDAIKGLKTQIALIYILASIALVTLTGFIIYSSVSGVVLQEKLDSTIMAVEKSGTYIESYVDKLKDMSSMIANDSSTIIYLSEKEKGEGVVEEVLIRERGHIEKMISNTILSDESIASIIIVGKKGQVISNEASLDMSMSEDMMSEQWYVNAIQAEGLPVLTSARMQKFNMNKDSWVISLSREIIDESGENIGVILMDMKYSVLDNYLKDLNLGKTGYAYILNQNNEVVYHEDTIYFEDPDLCLVLVETSEMKLGYDQERNQLYHEYHIKNTNWILSGIASLDELLTIRRQLIETIIFAALISLFFMLFMVRKIGQLTKDTAQKEKELKAYELNVLHSQINPHFLYNTLDTIVWMAEFGNSEKVVKLTQSLARFFRLSLSGGSETTTIENEIEHVRQYLAIQEERYKDKLSYQFKVDDEVLDIIIPKMILQPIVENAIYHGIRNQEQGGTITIEVSNEDQYIEMTVSDNGVGFDTNRIAQQDHIKKTKLGGVGIENVDKRLKLAYGDAYGVELRSKPGEGTTVILRVGNEEKTRYNRL